MIERIRRKIFVLKTRYRVARNNRITNQAFNYPTELPKRVIIAAVSVSIIFIIAGIAMNKNLLIGESTASIAPEQEPAAVKATAPVEPEKDLEAIAKTVIAPALPKNFMAAVEKYSSTLYILQEESEQLRVVKTYDVSMGKERGRKTVQGDLKTPVGIYEVLELLDDPQLEPKYGPRAFVLSYPNKYDRKTGRTGGGIWLHGTGIGGRTPDTKGCVELTDIHILELDEWLKISSKVAIFPVDFPLPFNNGKLDKHYFSELFFYGSDLQETDRTASVTLTEVSRLK
jgi:L,D-peptidoglycan transpeptidase YkuD (ErfK/YbiS/YcfS/YnhG family)